MTVTAQGWTKKGTDSPMDSVAVKAALTKSRLGLEPIELMLIEAQEKMRQSLVAAAWSPELQPLSIFSPESRHLSANNQHATRSLSCSNSRQITASPSTTKLPAASTSSC